MARTEYVIGNCLEQPNFIKLCRGMISTPSNLEFGQMYSVLRTEERRERLLNSRNWEFETARNRHVHVQPYACACTALCMYMYIHVPPVRGHTHHPRGSLLTAAGVNSEMYCSKSTALSDRSMCRVGGVRMSNSPPACPCSPSSPSPSSSSVSCPDLRQRHS